MGSTGRPRYPNFPGAANFPGSPLSSSSTPPPSQIHPLSSPAMPGGTFSPAPGGPPRPFYPPRTPPMQGPPPGSIFPHGPPPGPPPPIAAVSSSYGAPPLAYLMQSTTSVPPNQQSQSNLPPPSAYPMQSMPSVPPSQRPQSNLPPPSAYPMQSMPSVPPSQQPQSNLPPPFAYPMQSMPSVPPSQRPQSNLPPPSAYPMQPTDFTPPSAPPPFGSRGPPTFSRPMAPPRSAVDQSTHLHESLPGGLGIHGYSSFPGISSGQPYAKQGEQGLSGNLQGIVEEFESLSMMTVPGDTAVDLTALPRPPSLDIDTPNPTIASGCHPRYMRLTCNSIPNSQSLAACWHLPLGTVVHPLAEAPPGEEVPVVNFGAAGIVRCRRCQTYINLYATFADNGRRWRCNICGLLNDVPAEYFCPTDANGRRQDADERPELSLGSVEFVAPTEYMVRAPMPPVYFFLIDVSASAIRTGMLQVVVDTIKSCLDKLTSFPRTQIGFLTFDSALHFYSLKSSLTQPQMMVVTDLEDPFLPMPDDLLVNLSESRTVVEALLDSLPSIFENNANVEVALGPALKAVSMIMSHLGGKLLVFQSALPSLAVGRLKLRGDDPRIYGTDKECSLRTAEDPFYKQMAVDFSKYQIGVNIYSFCDRYIDLASLGTLAKYTGGQVYHYPSFQPHLHQEKLAYELGRDLTRETAWEAVLRIRCGKGIRFNHYHGHFLLRSSDLMALPAVDCDNAFAMELTLEETLLTTQTVYFQAALLYTSSTGERRIRIHTLAASVVSNLGDLYHSADVGAIMSIMSRLAIEKTLVSKLDEARQFIEWKLVQCLCKYRNIHAVQHSLSGRIIFPKSLQLLPLYCLALCKTMALRGGYADVHPDERSLSGFEMMVMSTSRLLNLLYPSLSRVDELLLKTGANIKDLQMIPLTAERLDGRGAFLFNNGICFVLWLGQALSSDFIARLLGMEGSNGADLSKIAVVAQQNEVSERLMCLLNSLRERNPALHQQCVAVRQGDQPREGIVLLNHLVEDRTTAGSLGYADWMVQIHRQVHQKG